VPEPPPEPDTPPIEGIEAPVSTDDIDALLNTLPTVD
jgi:hypothetical protein